MKMSKPYISYSICIYYLAALVYTMSQTDNDAHDAHNYHLEFKDNVNYSVDSI